MDDSLTRLVEIPDETHYGHAIKRITASATETAMLSPLWRLDLCGQENFGRAPAATDLFASHLQALCHQGIDEKNTAKTAKLRIRQTLLSGWDVKR